MKLGRVIVAAMLLTPIPFFGMAEPARAGNLHVVSLTGDMYLFQSGSFLGGIGSYIDPPLSGRAFLTHAAGDNRRTFKFDHCWGDVRGLLYVKARLNRNDTVSVSAVLSLYEGKSCGTDDLEGVKILDPVRITVGATLSKKSTVNNTEFGSPDFVTVNWALTYEA